MQRNRTLRTALGFVALIMVSSGISQLLTDRLYPQSALASPTAQVTPVPTAEPSPTTSAPV